MALKASVFGPLRAPGSSLIEVYAFLAPFVAPLMTPRCTPNRLVTLPVY